MKPGNIIRAFGVDHVVKLTGLSRTQLRYWDEAGFFRPYRAGEGRRGALTRAYQFRDVVGLRTLGTLRAEHRVPLPQLLKVARLLRRYKDAPWSDINLYVSQGQVFLEEPMPRKRRGSDEPAYAIVSIQTITDNLTREVDRLTQRSKEQIGKLQRNRGIVHNAWVVAGTRIPTRAIWRFHDAGYSTERIIREYPALTEQDIKAALAHEERLAQAA